MSENGNDGGRGSQQDDQENDGQGTVRVTTRGTGRTRFLLVTLRQRIVGTTYASAQQLFPVDILISMAEERGIHVPEGHPVHTQPGEFIGEFILYAMTVARKVQKTKGGAFDAICGIDAALKKLFGQRPDDEDDQDNGRGSGGGGNSNSVTVN